MCLIETVRFFPELHRLLSCENIPAAGFVRDTVFWAIYRNEVVGRISIRHELNEFLKRVGGHIGYVVRPSYRGKGFATEIMRQILTTDRAKAIGKLLITCDKDNIASEKIILKAGGVFDKLIDIAPHKPQKKHFWISLVL